jgi:prepilin-type N-terminal cleavage/methylation domain-containing protein
MTRAPNDSNGFTLVEMLMTIAVLGVVCAMAVGIMPSFINSNRADSSIMATLSAVELARDRSIGERREFQLIFTAPSHIQVVRIEVAPVGTTTVLDTVLENGQEFRQFVGIPDTPDAFGSSGPIAFGATPTIRFTSDGSLLDSAGDPVNGTVFLGEPNRPSSARAITIFGATGLIGAWKWNGNAWIR